MITDGWGVPRAAGRGGERSALDQMLVAHAMAQLPPDCRGVVWRACYHGWTTGEIAADLGIAEGEVKTQLHYALRTMQQTLLELGVAP